MDYISEKVLEVLKEKGITKIGESPLLDIIDDVATSDDFYDRVCDDIEDAGISIEDTGHDDNGHGKRGIDDAKTE